MIVKTKNSFPEYYPTGNKQVYQTSRLKSKNGVVEVKKNANFSGASEAAISTSLVTKSGFHKFIQTADNTGLYEGLISPVLACFIRPLSILGLPGSEKRDKQYAAAQSIATGIVSFVTALMIYTPLDEALKNVNKNLEKTKWLNDPMKKTIFTNIVSSGVKIATYGTIAAIMINTVPPVMSILFPKKKEDSKSTEKISNEQTVQQSTERNKKATTDVSSLGTLAGKKNELTTAVFKQHSVKVGGNVNAN